jgi:protein-S-isoprenylcysteine O-methyltransferase Ste14
MNELVVRWTGAGLIYVATAIRFYYEKRTKVRRVETVKHLPVARNAATLSSWTWFILLMLAPIPGLVPVGGLPVPSELKASLEIAGAIVLAAGVGLFYWCHLSLGEFWFGEPALKERHELIRRGPYRYVRHPMYTAYFTGYLGALLLMQSWPFLIPILFAPGFYLLSATEEDVLGATFPAGYAQYRAEAGRFLPRLF